MGWDDCAFTYLEEGLVEVCVPHGHAFLEIVGLLITDIHIVVGVVVVNSIAVVQIVHVMCNDRVRRIQLSDINCKLSLFFV